MTDAEIPDDTERDLDVRILRQALPYMRRHKGKTAVVKLGGHLVEDREALDGLAQDIALLHHVGMRVCVVHGGGPQATELSERLGVETKFVQGRRVTDDDTLEVAKMVFAGKINLEILSALRNQDLKAVGLNGVSGDLVHAKRREVTEMQDPSTGETESVDFGHVGDIHSVDGTLLADLLDRDYVPVVASLGSDERGNILNINADTVAVELAVDLGADKLLSMTQVVGVLRDASDPSTLVQAMTADEGDALVSDGVVAGGMIPKVRCAVDAVRRGVGRVHILNGLEPHAVLLELFTLRGRGTMVTLDPAVPMVQLDESGENEPDS
ncbi:MAG: acetylglutamate kinase [Planctomycetota bacterium]